MPEKGLGSVKVEKVTLWVATENYGTIRTFAVDHIIPRLQGMSEDCKVFAYDSEDYELIPIEARKATQTRKRG